VTTQPQTQGSGSAAARTATKATAPSSALLAGYRAAQASRLARITAIPVAAAARPASVQLGASQPPATRLVAQHSLWRTTPLSLLIAIAAGLAVGIGIVYAGWRNGDLIGRRRRNAARQYSRHPAASS
jgi:hypothetical protein